MRDTTENTHQYVAAMIVATAMMYLRILILILIFNQALFDAVWMWFLLMFAISIFLSVAIRYKYKAPAIIEQSLGEEKNPLEFKIAILFTVLFVAFTFITHFTIQYMGSQGLQALSLVVGVTDIDPFLLNLFQGHYHVSLSLIGVATFQAIISNNLIKGLYAIWLSGNKDKILIIGAFSIIIVVNALLIFFI
jgi:uncharacterized membrane protein (DUF4010 family)